MYDGKYEIFAWKYFCALFKLKKNREKFELFDDRLIWKIKREVWIFQTVFISL